MLQITSAEARRILGDNIRDFRIDQAMNQTDLARALGVSTSSVSNWERGNVFPRRRMLGNIATVLQVSVPTLRGTGRRNASQNGPRRGRPAEADSEG